MNHPCKIAFNQKLLHKLKKCVNFQVALKQHCATKSLIMRPACVEKYGFGRSTSAFAVSTPRQMTRVGWKLGSF